MAKVADVMSTGVQVIEPQESLRRAAGLMQMWGVGALPVCDGLRVLGMVTDRDITVRGVARGLNPDDACVFDVMSADAECCTADQSTDEVLRLMGDKQLRRLPVVDGDHGVIGIVSLGDLALRQSGHVDHAVRQISEPGSPSRPLR